MRHTTKLWVKRKKTHFTGAIIMPYCLCAFRVCFVYAIELTRPSTWTMSIESTQQSVFVFITSTVRSPHSNRIKRNTSNKWRNTTAIRRDVSGKWEDTAVRCVYLSYCICFHRSSAVDRTLIVRRFRWKKFAFDFYELWIKREWKKNTSERSLSPTQINKVFA